MGVCVPEWGDRGDCEPPNRLPVKVERNRFGCERTDCFCFRLKLIGSFRSSSKGSSCNNSSSVLSNKGFNTSSSPREEDRPLGALEEEEDDESWPFVFLKVLPLAMLKARQRHLSYRSLLVFK